MTTDEETDRALKAALEEIPADATRLSARVLTQLSEPARPTLLARLAAPLPLAGTSLAALACAAVLGYTLTPGADDLFTTIALGGMTGGF